MVAVRTEGGGAGPGWPYERMATRSGGGEVKEWRTAWCGLGSTNHQTWAQCKVWGSLETCLRGAALSPLPDHVPVVGDDGPLQVYHGRVNPLHLWEGGPYVTQGQ